ncbi:DTW domain protein [Novipirellula aureliae]|uniref:tRNA-uridine aminocarboxypropyltransferase n=1 Tax=Novipirellula aureliae TaxID=2527966 RepID=A0A5C6E6N9_9BACT|nr:DTW domain protein [Novipirellula aureliae]
MICEHNTDLARHVESLTLSQRAGILYPSDDARLLENLSPSERPDQLIILDGTWHHAKTMMRDIPRLRRLPRFRLAPASPGRYRIRREPNAFALSTLEATLSALQALEPELERLDQLMMVFDKMVDRQIQYTQPNSQTDWRRNQKRRAGSANVPRILADDLKNVVVAYGEQERVEKLRGRARRLQKPKPVFWTAQRCVTGEVFRVAIRSNCLNEADFADRLGIGKEQLENAVSLETFISMWHSFLRPLDKVAVYHPSTAKLLRNASNDLNTDYILKSVHLADRIAGGTLDDFIAAHQLPTSPRDDSRASQRLANLVAFAEYLSNQYGG